MAEVAPDPRHVVDRLALALDPYPRSEGAMLDSEFSPEGEETQSPFANLGRLRDK